jgi:endoplasmic reticulum-Golgi intermediate compartment protein 3
VNAIVRTAEQCLRDSSNPFANVRQGEGCRLTGSMKVNKVAGNVHMTIGESLVRDGAHIHQFIPSEAPKFNVSHTIHELTFGKQHPFLPTTNFLDNTVRYVDEGTGGTGLFQYFIRIVPTEHVDKHGQTGFVTNQFTYTEKFRPVVMDDYKRVPGHVGGAPVIPGIFFVYDLSPFLLQVSTAQVPLSHLVTRLLAIVGGVFCVLGLCDSLWYKCFKGK